MQSPLSHSQLRYYHRLDRLFAVITAGVLVMLWLGGYFLPVSSGQQLAFELLVLFAAVLAVFRYVYVANTPATLRRYSLTSVVNATIIGVLILMAGSYGIYIYALYFLLVATSSALLQIRHIILSTVLALAWTAYFFGLTNTFGLDSGQRWVIGGMIGVVLVGMAFFQVLLVGEVIRLFKDLETQKEQFIQDASHELRTPLTVIKTVGHLLQQPHWSGRFSRNSHEQQDIVDHLESATTDLELITEKLTKSSKRRLKSHKRS